MLSRPTLAAIAGATLALVACGGGHETSGTAPVASTSAKVHPVSAVRQDAAALEARRARGAAAFAKYCALCHGADAKGYAADDAPSLVSETFLASASDDFLARSIREGRPGTAMAGYAKARGGPLDEVELFDVLAFLRSKGGSKIVPPPLPATGVASWGEATYDANCRTCHGTREARGKAPHLANPSFLSAASDAFLRYAIMRGRPGTEMKAWAGALDESEIDDVVAHIRSWAQPPPAPPRPPTPPELPLEGPIVINPHGKAPSFTLREDRFVPADQVKKALDAKNKIVIVDARASSDWAAMHIPGSLSIPYYQTSRLDALPKDGTWIVAYCACPHHASGVVVDELRKRGFPHTAVLDEGILEWNKRKYPVVTAPPPSASAAASASAPPRR